MKKFLYIISAIASVLIAACSDEFYASNPSIPGASFEDGVQISLRFPDMQAPSTRALGEADKDYMKSLHLYLFVFDGSTLSQTMHIYPSETKWAAEANPSDNHQTSIPNIENQHLWFKTSLPQTDKNAIIHIVALDDSDGVFAEKVRKLGYGLEDIVMPSLSVSDNQDAYWQRIELGCPIKKTITTGEGDDMETIVEGTEDKIVAVFSNPVPLIRNFAKIELKSSVDKSRFEVIGWTVVNVLDGGSVVPYYTQNGSADVLFPVFAKWEDNPATIYDYENINGIQGYPGVSLSSANLRHTINEVGGSNAEAGENMKDIWTDAPKYIYERKYSTVNPLYILIYGEYKGNTSSKKGYYKLNLGKRNIETGLMTDYSVIRNIKYTINILDVSFEGYATPEEAANAPASNNISGDVVTKDMFSITDGLDMLYVNQINFIVTKPGQSVDFRFRYVTDITGNRITRDDLVEYDFYYDDGTRVGLPNDANGRSTDIIRSWNNPEPVKDEVNTSITWQNINIQFQEPSEELKQESFIVFSPPQNGGTQGLSRKINLILRNPWDFIRVAVYPGQWNDDTQFPDFDPETDENGNPYVGAEQGAKLTLFMELPAGLPEAMFPLDFTIESDRQNIQNDGAGNAAVEMGQSLFPDVPDNRIKYIKTITWSDYAPNGETSTASSRVIRMRLNTTTSLTNVDVNKIVSTIRIYNPYFNLTDAKFARDINANMVWDFSFDEWASTVEYLRDNTSSNNYTSEFNGLKVNNGGTTAAIRGALKAGSDGNGTYISMANTSNNITFSTVYMAAATTREGILKITADGATINLTCTGGGTLSAQDGTAYNGYETKTWKVTVPATPTTLTFTIRTSATNNTLKVYKIEWYPVGE